MSIDEIRPFFSGIVAAIISFLLAHFLLKWLPNSYDGKPKRVLKDEYGLKIKISNLLAILGINIGFSLYFFNCLPQSDWRGIGVGFGLMSMLPMLWLVGSSISNGVHSIKEAFAAFAICQNTPYMLLYGSMIFFIVVGVIAITSLLVSPP